MDKTRLLPSIQLVVHYERCMPGLPLNRRPNDSFLSHSSRDKSSFVDGLYEFLTKRAGLNVWYDRALVSGEIASNIEKAIGSSRSAVVILSRHSVQSHWVELECNRLQEEISRFRDFRIATVRLDGVDPPALLRAYKHIDIEGGALSLDSAALLLESLVGGKETVPGKRIYICRSWHEAESRVADRIVQHLQSYGLSPVCDSTDQPHYEVTRVRSIMQATGGLVAVLPHRGNGQTSRFMISEIKLAHDLGLPTLLFVERGVALPTELPVDEVLQIDAGDLLERRLPFDVSVDGAIEELVQKWKRPSTGEHVFFGHALEESANDRFQVARRLLSRVSGLPVTVGGLVAGADAQNDIVRLIREAALCVIDITNLSHDGLPAKVDFALNSCIEAGIALGANQALYLTCKGPRRSPPFMFRNKQVWFYDEPVDLMGTLSRIAAMHRRMVL